LKDYLLVGARPRAQEDQHGYHSIKRRHKQALKEHRNARTPGLSQAAPESTNKQAWKRPK
jgi:hypothetical protein